jgi:uncharacterized protein with FMN-binding domain
MKRVVLAIVSTVAALVLVLSFKTHGQSAVATPPVVVRTTTPTTTTTTTSCTGDAVNTRYGPVQVQIGLKNGKVVSSEAVVYPMNDPRDQQINSYAIPALNSEAASNSSASIDMISGATFTSEGYIASLQSALDKAGL